MDLAYRRTKNDRDYKYPQISGWKVEAKRILGSPRLGCYNSMELGLKKNMSEGLVRQGLIWHKIW
jgi:hypothetical protein